jgi:hypothetical protein
LKENKRNLSQVAISDFFLRLVCTKMLFSLFFVSSGKTSAEITVAVCAEGVHPPLDPLWPTEIHDICGDCFTIGRENLAGPLTMRDISQQIKGLTLSPRFENDFVN